MQNILPFAFKTKTHETPYRIIPYRAGRHAG